MGLRLAPRQARCQADLLEAGERRHTQGRLCGAICQAQGLARGVANQAWQRDGWVTASAKDPPPQLAALASYCCWRTGPEFHFYYPPPLFPFLSFLFLSPPTHRVLLRVRMLYYLRQEVIGDQADRILEGTDSRLASTPFRLLPPSLYLSLQHSQAPACFIFTLPPSPLVSPHHPDVHAYIMPKTCTTCQWRLRLFAE